MAFLLTPFQVPVIAIFTKFDALVTAAYGTLRDKENKSREEAKQGAPEVAIRTLEESYVNRLLQTRYKPKKHLYLEGAYSLPSNVYRLVILSQTQTCKKKTQIAQH